MRPNKFDVDDSTKSISRISEKKKLQKKYEQITNKRERENEER